MQEVSRLCLRVLDAQDQQQGQHIPAWLCQPQDDNPQRYLHERMLLWNRTAMQVC